MGGGTEEVLEIQPADREKKRQENHEVEAPSYTCSEFYCEDQERGSGPFSHNTMFALPSLPTWRKSETTPVEKKCPERTHF